jgi:hypothetical protein
VLSGLRSKVTYANVVASLALFIALGGISYAAVTIPKNSVGAKQLKAGAVTAEKVKDGSLSVKDLAPGAIATTNSTPGPKGDKGDKGEKGDKGDKGEPADLGFLDSSHDLPGLAVAQLSIDAYKFQAFKAYRIDCTTATLCTLTIGGELTKNIEYNAWYELAVLGDPGATKSFSLTEYTTKEGNPVARYHVTDGRPVEMRTLNNRFEMVFSSEFIQRVSV